MTRLFLLAAVLFGLEISSASWCDDAKKKYGEDVCGNDMICKDDDCVCKPGYVSDGDEGCIKASDKGKDCEYSDWGKWSKCSVSCGSGTRKRDRTIKKEAKKGGKACDKAELEQSKACSQEACKDCIKAPCIKGFTETYQSGVSGKLCGVVDPLPQDLNNKMKSIEFLCNGKPCRVQIFDTTAKARVRTETLYSHNDKKQNLKLTSGSSVQVDWVGEPKCYESEKKKCGKCPCIKAYVKKYQKGPYYEYCGRTSWDRDLRIDHTDNKLQSFEFDCGTCDCAVSFYDGKLGDGAWDAHYSWNGAKQNIKWTITGSLEVWLPEKTCKGASSSNKKCGCPCVWLYDRANQKGNKMRVCELGSHDDVIHRSNFDNNIRSFEFDCGDCECRASFYDGLFRDGAYDIFHSSNGLKRNMIALPTNAGSLKVEFWEDVKPKCQGFGSAYEQCGCPCVKVYKQPNQHGDWVRVCETTAWDIDIIANGYEPNMESFEFDCGGCDCKVTFWDHWVTHGTTGGGIYQVFRSSSEDKGNLKPALAPISSTLKVEFTKNCQYEQKGQCSKPCITAYKSKNEHGESKNFCGGVDTAELDSFDNKIKSFKFDCNGKPCRVAFYDGRLDALDRSEVHYSYNGQQADLKHIIASSLNVEFLPEPVCEPEIKAKCGQCPCVKLYTQKSQMGPYVRLCGLSSWDRDFYREHIDNKVQSFQFDCGSCECQATFWDGVLYSGSWDTFYSWNGLKKDNSWSVASSAEVMVHPGKSCSGQSKSYKKCGCPCVKVYKELNQEGDYAIFCEHAPHDTTVRHSSFDNNMKSMEFDCGSCECRATFYDGLMYDGAQDVVHSWNGHKHNLDMRVASSLKVEFWEDVKQVCQGFGSEYDKCGCPCVKVFKKPNQKGEWIRFCETTGWDTEILPNGFEPQLESFEFDCGGCDCKVTFWDHWPEAGTSGGGDHQEFFSTDGQKGNLKLGLKDVSSNLKVEFLNNCVYQ